MDSTAEISYPWRKLLKNETFCSRIIIIPPAFFILFLCICYTISSLLQLELDDYWCDDQVTLQDIRRHSMNEGLPLGVEDQCWALGDVRDQNLLWSRQSYGYHWIYNARTISRFCLLLTTTIILTILIVYYLIQLVIDIRKYRKGALSIKIEQAPNKVSNWKRLLIKVVEWESRTFRMDSGNWIILKVIGEVFEILMQSQALWAYNGTPIINTETLYLAIEEKFIILFAVFLFLNCVACAVLWLFYAFKPKLCHGLLFKLLLVFVDVLFVSFYAFFPILTILGNKNNDSDPSFLVSLASLETDNSLSNLFSSLYVSDENILVQKG